MPFCGTIWRRSWRRCSMDRCRISTSKSTFHSGRSRTWNGTCLLYTSAYKRVPVCCEILSDTYTPVEVMRILRKASRHCYLLESASQEEAWGRYSFLGYDPTMEITCLDGEVTIRENLGDGTETVTTKHVDHPGDTLREVLARYKSPVMRCV